MIASWRSGDSSVAGSRGQALCDETDARGRGRDEAEAPLGRDEEAKASVRRTGHIADMPWGCDAMGPNAVVADERFGGRST